LYNEDVQTLPDGEEFDYPKGYNEYYKETPPLSGGYGGNQALWEVLFTVEAKVHNIGKYKGGFVGQLYVGGWWRGEVVNMVHISRLFDEGYL
jgi:beta-glucosidase